MKLTPQEAFSEKMNSTVKQFSGGAIENRES
jgi:hypothetical protein